MSKQNQNIHIKSKKYITKFKGEFTLTADNAFHCNLCACIVDSLKKSTQNAHRKIEKHNKNVKVFNLVTSNQEFSHKNRC